MKYFIVTLLVLSFQSSFASYKGHAITPDVSCVDMGADSNSGEDRRDMCQVIPTTIDTKEYDKVHNIEGKDFRIRFNVEKFYSLYVSVTGDNEVVSLGYNELRVEEDSGVLPQGQRTFEPGTFEELEWRFHSGERPGFHGLIVRKSTFDLIASEPRTIFHIFKLDSGRSCLLGFVDEIEMARQWSDKSDELPCQ